MANYAEEDDDAFRSSESGSSEDESEDELEVNMEFNFGEVNLDSEDDENEAQAGEINPGAGPDQPQEVRNQDHEVEVFS